MALQRNIGTAHIHLGAQGIAYAHLIRRAVIKTVLTASRHHLANQYLTLLVDHMQQ